MSKILFRDTVKFRVLTPSLAWMLYCFEKATRVDTRQYIISSVNDSQHLENSKHYRDMAFDFFSLDFHDNAEKEALRLEVQSVMNLEFPGKFTVIIENMGMRGEHFHCQVTKGQTFP